MFWLTGRLVGYVLNDRLFIYLFIDWLLIDWLFIYSLIDWLFIDWLFCLGTLTVEEVYKDRDQFASLVREVSFHNIQTRNSDRILYFTLYI